MCAFCCFCCLETCESACPWIHHIFRNIMLLHYYYLRFFFILSPKKRCFFPIPVPPLSDGKYVFFLHRCWGVLLYFHFPFFVLFKLHNIFDDYLCNWTRYTIYFILITCLYLSGCINDDVIDDVPPLSDDSDIDDDDDCWEDAEREEMNMLVGDVKCLFSEQVFSSVDMVFNHIK